VDQTGILDGESAASVAEGTVVDPTAPFWADLAANSQRSAWLTSSSPSPGASP